MDCNKEDNTKLAVKSSDSPPSSMAAHSVAQTSSNIVAEPTAKQKQPKGFQEGILQQSDDAAGDVSHTSESSGKAESGGACSSSKSNIVDQDDRSIKTIKDELPLQQPEASYQTVVSLPTEVSALVSSIADAFAATAATAAASSPHPRASKAAKRPAKASKSAASPRDKKNRSVGNEDAPEESRVSELPRQVRFGTLDIETYHTLIVERVLDDKALYIEFEWDTRTVKDSAAALTYHTHHSALPHYWVFRLEKAQPLFKLAYSLEYDGDCMTIVEKPLEIQKRKCVSVKVVPEDENLRLISDFNVTILNTRASDRNDFKLEVQLLFTFDLKSKVQGVQ